MINYIALVVAIGLSTVAAYFSILGLTAIFAASYWPVIIMGSMLEAAKVVAASWAFRNWNHAPAFIRYYLVIAVAILMMITSMGTFGYLSKAHIEQTASVGDLSAQVAVYDERIKNLNENIEANRKLLKQFDEAVDQVMSRSTDSKGAERSLQIRKAQQKDRSHLMEEISTLQKEVGRLSAERSPLVSQVKKVEKEVGPIKYIAELFIDRADDSFLEKTVRWVIIMIVTVFDPLAVLLLIAANMGMIRQTRISKMNNTRAANIEVNKDLAAEKRFKKLQELTGKASRSKITIDKNKIRKMT
jgi:F0F1-type ATP synthase membrane subunit b/b'